MNGQSTASPVAGCANAALLQPVLDSQSRHLLKISQIRGQHDRLVRQGNRRDFQIVRSDPNFFFSQPQEFFRGGLIEGHNSPFGKEPNQGDQPRVGGNLLENVFVSIDQGQPAPVHFFDTDGRRGEVLIQRDKHIRHQRLGLPAVAISQERHVIGVKNNHRESLSDFVRESSRLRRRFLSSPDHP